MNIVIISNILPYPLSSGGAQAQFNMIDELRKKHHFAFLFTEDGKNKLSSMKELQKIWPEVNFYPFSYIRQLCYPKFFYEKARRAIQLKFMAKSQRFQIERTLRPYGVEFSHDFISYVNKVIQREHADIVQVEFFPCLHIVDYLPKGIKKVFIEHEIRFVRNRRLLSSFNMNEKQIQLENSIKYKEISDLNNYDTIVTLTEKDKEILISNGVINNIQVSPAAVSAKLMGYMQWNGRLSFVGGYAHIPNQEGIEWFIKHIAELLPKGLVLDIIGGGWPERYETPQTHLKGFVKELSDGLRGTIMIVPLLTGSGMRMKILEAAAMSLPFVTTTVGVEGLDFKDHESCLIADTPEDFANAIKELANNEQLRERLGTTANKIFQSRYSKPVLANIRNEIYNTI